MGKPICLSGHFFKHNTHLNSFDGKSDFFDKFVLDLLKPLCASNQNLPASK